MISVKPIFQNASEIKKTVEITLYNLEVCVITKLSRHTYTKYNERVKQIKLKTILIQS